nr:XrtA/PEP-CTERM system TPR-repeat protein PrsT [Rhodoferax sp.]
MNFPPNPRFLLAPLLLALLGSSSVVQAADAKASKYYEDALIRYEKKDLDGAVIQLKNALQIDKSMLPVQMLLGKALLQNGDVAAAEVAFLEAIRLGVNRAEVVIPLGQAYMAQGKHRLIFEQSTFNVAGLPGAVQLQLQLLRASASADLGDVRNAMKAVEEARALDNRDPAVWLAEVPIRIRARQFKEAAVVVDRALGLAPESAEVWYQKGAVAHVSGDLQATLDAYARAIKLQPEHVEARVARAGLLLDLNRASDASVDVTELSRIAPGEPRAAYLRALLAERNGKPEEAQAALKEVTHLIDPVPIDFIRYRTQLLMLNGLAHFGLNELEKAKQYLETFQRQQGNTPASKLLAQIYMADSNVDRAIDVLENYLKANPADGQAMTLLGSAYLSKGQSAKATSLMQQALKSKDNPAHRTVLGLSLIRSGEAGIGLAELEAAYKQDSTQTQAGVSLVSVYLRTGRAAKAVAVAESLVKQQPGSPSFFNVLGMAKGQAGDLPGAKAAFEQAVKLNDKFVAPKINLARLEIAAKAYDAATVRLAAILKVNEKNTEAMGEMAVLSERRGQQAEAQRWLEKATDLAGPKDVRWGLALSEFHMRHDRPGPALEAVKKVSGKLTDNLGVLLAYAKAQIANRDMAGAKGTLTSATRVADYKPAPQMQIALLQLAANNVPGAAYSLEKALSTQPEFLPAQALMTEVELRQGDAAKAEKRAKDILAKNPKRAIGHSLLGDVAVARNQPVVALEAYRRAHQTEPSSDTVLRLIAAMSNQDGGKPALQLAEQWMKTHPADARTQRALSDGYARSGNFTAAKKAYEGLLKITPEDGGALNNLANVLLRLKDPGAISVAEQAVAKFPGNANAIDTLGWALYQGGQTDKALQLLRDARLRDPAHPEIRFHLATVLAQTGRKTEAREELEAAMRGGQNFESAAEAAALMKTLK